MASLNDCVSVPYIGRLAKLYFTIIMFCGSGYVQVMLCIINQLSQMTHKASKLVAERLLIS